MITQSPIAEPPRPDLLSWAPFTTRLIVADHISRGHPFCIEYAIASWPESVLPADDWLDFCTSSATTPTMQTVVLRFPRSHFQVEVRTSSHPHVTIADVLRAIYTVRGRFPRARFIGLSPAGQNYLRLHLDY
ncbi:hypothetical protein AX15_003019 [Amanita polypyramis BW_CC]|nr:hypothetical protein AX15_003019 [Amanita polypyramis BW_CC]